MHFALLIFSIIAGAASIASSILAELCELAVKAEQFKTNKFILDFIRIKNPVSSKK